MVGLVMDLELIRMNSDIPALWWPRVLFSCVDRLSEQGCVVAVLPTGVDRPSSLMKLDAVVGVERSDGTPGLPAGLPFGLPVFYGGPGAPPGCARVTPDFSGLVHDVMTHLYGRGARRVALIAPMVQISAPDLIKRAFLEWHVTRGEAPGPVLVGHDAAGQVDAAVAAGCDAIFSTTNQSPVLLRALTGRGLRVPADMRLVTLSEGVIEHWMEPSVTVVSLQGDQNGRVLADAILTAVASGVTGEVVVRHRLIEGGSTR